ncbi:MAG TPA: DUF892 family protein [Chthoniobacterales bacterium]
MPKLKKTTSTGDPPRSVPLEFINRLAEMHMAERELTIALPLLAAVAKSKHLKTLLQIHLEETKDHVKTTSAEKLANELLGALAAGKGPLKKLVEKASLKRAGATAG